MSTRPRRRGLLDTSTIIAIEGRSDAAGLPGEPLISTVSLVELSVGPLTATSEEERAARQTRLQQAEADIVPLPLMPMRHALSGLLQRRSGGPGGRPAPAPTTR